MAVTCTPNDMLAAAPCALCLSEKQLWAVIVLLLCRSLDGASADCSPAVLTEDAKCFECLTDKEMLVAGGNALWKYAVDNRLIDADGGNVDDAVCLDCLPLHWLKAIALRKLCGLLAQLESLQ